MTSIDPDAKLKDEEEEEETANGAGRGKDMQVFNEEKCNFINFKIF